MKCEKCKATVSGTAKRCPLCQSDLLPSPDGQAPEAVFPVIPLQLKRNRLFLSIIAFITAAAAGICVLINLSVPSQRAWSLFVVGGIISFWLSFSVVIRKMGNIIKTIIWQVVLISGIAVVWDVSTGFYKWSIDFVVPLLCTCAMVAMAVIAKIQKLQVNDYMIYLFIDSILGGVSMILLLCGVLNIVVPSIICIASSIISLSALFAFEGKTLISEIHRRLHL